MRVRKKGTGSSSHGYVWDEPGEVLDVPAEHAAELVAIAPHEFEVLPDLEPDGEGDDQGDDGEGQGEQQEAVTEPEPQPDPEPEREPEETKPARGRRRVTEA